MTNLLLTLSLIAFANSVGGACLPSGEPSNSDLLAIHLSRKCPTSVQELKTLFFDDGLTLNPSIVANRGRHNPELGSFSIFETTSGHSRLLNATVSPEHLYFGHFTTLEKDSVTLDQAPGEGKLLIEVMAYDFKKKVYNFYELIGHGTRAKWHYRGDSTDALLDNKNLKIGPSGSFGQRMRCSACHASGGPIMKELEFPHNDWWTVARGLPFGSHKLSPELEEYLTQFVDASDFSKSVKKGMRLLEKKQTALTLKERLRPLFCSTEINIKSDGVPLETPNAYIEVSSEVFVDPLLYKEESLLVEKGAYLRALMALGSNFPETNRPDADHAFLAPVRSEVNTRALLKLIDEKTINLEFALDILSIDFENPLFSELRCGLLKLIPESPQWKEEFKMALKRKGDSVSLKVADNLSRTNGEEHRMKARAYIASKKMNLTTYESLVSEVTKLAKLRKSVFDDEISKNPKGQILEPGFRIVFPQIAKQVK